MEIILKLLLWILIIIAIIFIYKCFRKGNNVITVIINFIWIAFLSKKDPINRFNTGKRIGIAIKIIPTQKEYNNLCLFFWTLKKITILECGSQAELSDPLNQNIYLNSVVSQNMNKLQMKDNKNIIISTLNSFYNKGIIDDSSTIMDVYYNQLEYIRILEKTIKDCGGYVTPIDFPMKPGAFSSWNNPQ